MSGADVKALQSDLTKLGFTTAETGVFGSQTARNVRAFERSENLTINGIAGAKVIAALKSALAAISPNALSASGSGGSALSIKKQTKTTDPTDIPVVKQNGGSAHLGNRTLRPGMHGHDVRVLQGYLSLVGYPTSVDGSYGPATKRSVLAFQQAHSMTANGIVTYSETLVLRQSVASALASGPVGRTRINPDGTATAPQGAPQVVQRVVAAANQIIDKPYIYAGGHASWKAAGYDCSGSVSYALHGAGLLSSPEDSTGLESWGKAGPGKWITVYADAAHTFLVVAGRAFDTADFGGPNIPGGTGPRWRSNPTGNLADGGDYVVRHPAGL
jgi:peptidoglycan hydrolase-like protein with peptidoglycan-binding domain